MCCPLQFWSYSYMQMSFLSPQQLFRPSSKLYLLALQADVSCMSSATPCSVSPSPPIAWRWRLIASVSCCDLSRRDRSGLRRTDDTTEWSCGVAPASLLNQQRGVCPPSCFALSLSHHILLFLQEGGHGVCIFIFHCCF